VINKISISDTDRDILNSLNILPDELQDDYCDYSKVVVKKPWGYEYLIFQNSNVAGWVLYVKNGAQTSMHCHPNKKTSLVVLQGEVVCSTPKLELNLGAGDGLLIEKGVFHQTRGTSAKGAFVLEIESPINKRDLVRFKDQYGRERQGYERSDQHAVNIQNYNYLSLQALQLPHNCKKRFGQCALTFRTLESPRQLDEILDSDDQDVVCVLDGQLVNGRKDRTLRVGDTVKIKDIREISERSIVGPLTLLIVKRIDSVMKVSDCVVSILKETHKVKQVFVVPGDANVHLLDSIGRDEDLRFISTHMEKGASLAAEAYGKVRMDLSVLVVSSGASGPNAIPGVANAWIDSVPMLVISGQAASQKNSDEVRQLGNKSLNIIDMVKAITKYAVKVTDPAAIRYHLEKAIFLANDGRPGPVWLDVPIDIQGTVIDEQELKSFDPQHEAPRPTASVEILSGWVDEVLRLLKASRRPVLLGGNGVRIAGAQNDFIEFLGQLAAPTLLSRRGADLLAESHPLFFGRPGGYGQRRANFIIQNCDLLLSVGCRLSMPFIGRNVKAFARAAKKIVVDVDLEELRKSTIHPDLAIHADAGEFIREMLRRLSQERSSIPVWKQWLQRCRQWSEHFPPLTENYKKTNLVQPYFFVRALSENMRENETIVVDGGPVMNYAMQAFQFKPGQRMISSTGLELPGFALPGALGVSIAEEQERVICLCEDRGFYGGIQELETLSRYRFPVKIFVLKSRGHSYIRQIQKEYFGERYVATDQEILFETPSVQEISRSYGFRVDEIKFPGEMNAKIEKVLRGQGAAVCEIQVDSLQEFVPRPGLTIKEDGRWIAKPLEDMYPHFDPVTMKENMCIELWQED